MKKKPRLQTHPFKISLVFIAYLAVLGGFAEISARVLLRFSQRYDVEMTRYALELKNAQAPADIGFVHKPSQKAHLMGVDISLNSYGLRGPEFSRLPEPDVRRIVFLGDSLTLGWGVPENSTFAHLLQENISKTQKVEIINTGHGNFNSAQEVAYYFNYAQYWGASQIVVFYFINDAEVTPRVGNWEFLGHSRFLTLLWSSIRSLHLLSKTGVSNYIDYYRGLYLPDQPGWLAARKSIERLANVCRERKITLQFVILPDFHEFHPYPFRSEHRMIDQFLTAERIPFLDLMDSFQNIQDARKLWVAYDDTHPNARAHALIAQLTEKFIQSAGR